MRRLIDRRVLIVGMLWLTVGCGSSGTSSQGDDGLTMALMGFTGVGIEQADFVSDTTAQVDICQGLCSGGSQGEFEVEPFTSTFVNALFVNRGKADIILDSYTVFSPESGVPMATRRISARLIGGRCIGPDSEKQCAVDDDCGVGLASICTHTQTAVGVLLYDFDFKQRVRQGECPVDIESLTLDTELTFSGTDETGERRTVHAGYVATYDNFDNCDDQ
jgi:hypothetical protein